LDENVAIVVDGSYARTDTPMPVLRDLRSLVGKADRDFIGKVGRVIFIDSPMGKKCREQLVAADYELLVEPWCAVREVEEQRWDRREGFVRVRRQVGVDATVAAVLMQCGDDPGIKTILCFTGDQDFAETVGYIVKRQTAVRVLTFHSNVAEDLVKRSSGEVIDLSAAYRVRPLPQFTRVCRERSD
jgi:uncharacterized LabA/DUF88 family protein